MGQITRWEAKNAIERRIQHELERSIDFVVALAKYTTFAVPKIGQLVWLLGNMVVTTLVLTKEEMAAVRGAGKLTTHKLAAHLHRREACKHELLDLLDTFNHTVHHLIERC